MSKKDKQLALFETEKRKRFKRERYLKFEDVKSSIIKSDNGKKTCFDCKEPIKTGQEIVHIYEYELNKFSAFLCMKCYEVFKTNEVEL